MVNYIKMCHGSTFMNTVDEFEHTFDCTEDEYKAIDDLLALESFNDLEKEKRKVVLKYKLSGFPSNSQIIHRAKEKGVYANHPWVTQLQRKPTRSASGISIVAVMVPPDLGGLRGSCPFNCTYCPSADIAPKSYIGHEPSTLRAISYNYDPYRIVKGRIEQLRAIGHYASKIHLVIQGGTFLATPEQEQDFILKGCFDAMAEKSSKTVDEAIEHLETSKIKNVGITYETRPDFCRPYHVDRLLARGGTFLEIGVQTLSDQVLKTVKRGHNVEEVYNAIKTAKDAGFKVTLHMMPNLYSTPQEDIAMFKELFTNPKLRPDGLKIYPLLVVPGTQIHTEWKLGRFQPYSDDELIAALAEIKRDLPEYTRIHRIQRDIPVKYGDAGLLLGNIRNIVKDFMDQKGWKCRCIRCREVGQVQNSTNYIIPPYEELQLETYQYEASDGKEWFFSVVDPKTRVLFGFLRMRFPSNAPHRPEFTSKTAIVRELHVYGQELEVGAIPLKIHAQHRGLGKRLMKHAETIALEAGFKEMLVISGIGVREYYKHIGYQQKGPYVAKQLEE